MSRIYTGAKQACIWLEDNDDSTKAIRFIREILRLENFDSISEKKENASRWQFLLTLMQRPWFSRRWVVQKIALAKSAAIYYPVGQDFAVAVELFVEVETATHRLSEVMRKDEKFGQVPQWFEHVSELGASILVQATGKVFRRDGVHRTNSAEDIESNTQGRHRNPKSKSAKRTNGALVPLNPFKSPDWKPQRPLLSLEYLVSISSYLERKPFRANYSRPYSDMCKYTISCIEKSGRSDPTRALDILCRPWAPGADGTPGNVVDKKPIAYKFLSQREQREPLWKRKHDGRERYRYVVGFAPNDVAMEIDNPEERIGAPTRQRVVDYRSNKEYWEDCEEVWRLYGYDTFMKKVEPYLPEKTRKPKERDGSINQDDYTSSESEESEDGQNDADQDIELPSWVSRISGASFALYRLPGMKKGNTKVEFRSDRRLRFRKRPGSRQNPASGHYSLYTEGFILTEIDMVAEPARLGGIPKTWTQIAGWDHAVDGKTERPAELWRTLVADRGKDNRNPPYYYATGCKESVRKGGLRGGSVDTGALISSERVQAIIWNRRLIRTKDPPRVLGLAGKDVQKGDLVCIVHGCTVPLILRQHKKDVKDLEVEQMQDSIQSMKAVLSILRREREKNPDLETIWKREVQEELEEVNREMTELRNQEELARKERQKWDDQQRKRKNDAERRLEFARTAREEAEKASKRPAFMRQRSTTMPALALPSMAGGGPQAILDADVEVEEPIVSADTPRQVNEGLGGGLGQPARQPRPIGNSPGHDGPQTPKDKSKEQMEKEE
ncbi:hypothetical protein VP1G_05218 [Cytospora mali]|uniref:Heterokaryon incompatibility domain-containing protein n=1 Tax=Cytospora mali TaxID=578113 RepID=A0A194V1Y7_CYTMA|nr:hypothetical protein VP1G_05218 [Valsa mali var. pyri (nom. inval.)]